MRRQCGVAWNRFLPPVVTDRAYLTPPGSCPSSAEGTAFLPAPSAASSSPTETRLLYRRIRFSPATGSSAFLILRKESFDSQRFSIMRIRSDTA